MPSLAEYLVFMASHPRARARHNSSAEGAKDEMEHFGLTPEQQKIMQTGDVTKIQEAANNEIKDSVGNALTLKFEIPARLEFIRYTPPPSSPGP